MLRFFPFLLVLATGTGSAQAPTNEVPAPEPAPFDAHGWPVWLSAHRLRGLPVCTDETFPVVAPTRTNGEPFRCHPPFPEPPGLNWTMQLGMPLGLNFAGTGRAGRAMGFDFGVDFFFSRLFGVGFGYRFLGTRPTGDDLDGDFVVDGGPERVGMHAPHLGLRLRVLTDEPSRRAWLFGLDGTYAFSARPNGSDTPSGPILALSIQRQVGILTSPFWAGFWRFGFRYEQGLSRDLHDYRVILATTQLGFEWNEDAPRGFESLREPPKRAIAIHATVPLLIGLDRPDAGMTAGIHTTFGLPFREGLVEPRLRLGLERLAKPANVEIPTDERFAARRRAMVSGHLRVRPVRWLHADVGGGYRHVFGDRPRVESSGAFVEAGLGAGFVGCGVAFEPTLIYRHHFFDDTDVSAHEIGLMFHIGFASSQRAYPGRCGTGSAPGSNPAPPPPPVVATPEPTPEPTPPPPPPSTTIEIEPPRAQIEVEVRPVRVEVVIGAVVFGGAVQMRLDLSRLPLDQLRRAGRVELEIVAPPAARARVEAELRATLDREGARIDATTHVEPTGVVQEVKAIFTLWPPGTR
ncbi:MAG: hypothetical protein KC586_19470 [Myxococcales bacterium]|nr:hypothetical protein [Myxococcales bacterium]